MAGLTEHETKMAGLKLVDSLVDVVVDGSWSAPCHLVLAAQYDPSAFSLGVRLLSRDDKS